MKKETDKVCLYIWFYNYSKGDEMTIPTIALNNIPAWDEMQGWSFDMLEQYVLANASKKVLSVIKKNPIKVIEVVNHTKGWVKPIARSAV